MDQFGKTLLRSTTRRIRSNRNLSAMASNARRHFSGVGASGTSTVDANQEREWKNPDSANDPKAYVRYLDGIFEGMGPSGPAVDYKRQVYELMDIQPADSIIDVGCGTGADVMAIAELLSTKTKRESGGRVTGVDISETMVDEAKEKLSERRRETTDKRISERIQVEFYAGNAQQLADVIPSNSYDVVRSDRSLQHMPDPKAAVEEMVRISKPGVGRVVVSEPDWETLVIDSPSHSRVTRKIINHFTDTRVNGWMGRQLYRLFQNAGLVDVQVLPMTCPIADLDFIRAAYLDKAQRIAVEASVVTEQEASGWMAELVDLNRAGQFFSTLTMYCARGRVM